MQISLSQRAEDGASAPGRALDGRRPDGRSVPSSSAFISTLCRASVGTRPRFLGHYQERLLIRVSPHSCS